jgi:hypothetical protein
MAIKLQRKGKGKDKRGSEKSEGGSSSARTDEWPENRMMCSSNVVLSMYPELSQNYNKRGKLNQRKLAWDMKLQQTRTAWQKGRGSEKHPHTIRKEMENVSKDWLKEEQKAGKLKPSRSVQAQLYLWRQEQEAEQSQEQQRNQQLRRQERAEHRKQQYEHEQQWWLPSPLKTAAADARGSAGRKLRPGHRVGTPAKTGPSGPSKVGDLARKVVSLAEARARRKGASVAGAGASSGGGGGGGSGSSDGGKTQNVTVQDRQESSDTENSDLDEDEEEDVQERRKMFNKLELDACFLLFQLMDTSGNMALDANDILRFLEGVMGMYTRSTMYTRS